MTIAKLIYKFNITNILPILYKIYLLFILIYLIKNDINDYYKIFYKMPIDIPQSFICPISFKLMREPYIDIYGDTYEKDVIFRWLETKQESPLSRRRLTKADLRLNRSLQDTINDLLQKKIIISTR